MLKKGQSQLLILRLFTNRHVLRLRFVVERVILKGVLTTSTSPLPPLKNKTKQNKTKHFIIGE